MIEGLNPAYIFFIGAVAVTCVGGRVRNGLTLLVPILGVIQLFGFEYGSTQTSVLLDTTLTPLRIDKLSFVFAVIFHLAAFLGAVYAAHEKGFLHRTATLVYAGAAIGAVLAGDLITLFIYWEIAAISSVYFIWARKTETAFKVGLRYLIIQIASGVLLLAGAVLFYRNSGSLAFDHIGLTSLGGALIFIAFGIKCAFPFLHNWLQDAYPEATITGTVILSAFTTKLAVYALARGFAGEPSLIWIGATMTAFPIFYAVIENDLRRVLAYSLNNQLGFMVVGVGVGTELAINGAAAHAFAHILYKALLFMAMGAVLLRAGTIKASRLGGLYKSMPVTTVFCIIGSASISAFPLLSGFVTKSMILTATADEGYWITFLVLLFASAGVLDHSGIKIPFFSFFAHDSGIRCKEAPGNMLVAMGLTAALCIFIGVYPDPLYQLLPYTVTFVPYTLTHVVTQLQLLVFAGIGFAWLYRSGLYPPEIPSLNLDFDWVYRKAGVFILLSIQRTLQQTRSEITNFITPTLMSLWHSSTTVSPDRLPIIRPPRAGEAVGIVVVALGLMLLFVMFQ